MTLFDLIFVLTADRVAIYLIWRFEEDWRSDKAKLRVEPVVTTLVPLLLICLAFPRGFIKEIGVINVDRGEILLFDNYCVFFKPCLD